MISRNRFISQTRPSITSPVSHLSAHKLTHQVNFTFSEFLHIQILSASGESEDVCLLLFKMQTYFFNGPISPHLAFSLSIPHFCFLIFIHSAINLSESSGRSLWACVRSLFLFSASSPQFVVFQICLATPLN